MLEPIDLLGKYTIADKGFKSDRFVHWLEERGAMVVNPIRKTAKHPRDVDRHFYVEHHLVSNLFLKFKARLRFATRYKKCACLFLQLSFLPPAPFGLLAFEDIL